MGWIWSNSLYIGIKFHKESIKIINLFKYSISFSTVVLVSCCKLEVTWSCGQAVAASWKLKYTVATEYYQNYYRELISESFKLMPHVYATFLIKELLQLIFGLKGLLCSCILNLYLVWHNSEARCRSGKERYGVFQLIVFSFLSERSTPHRPSEVSNPLSILYSSLCFLLGVLHMSSLLSAPVTVPAATLPVMMVMDSYPSGALSLK